MQSHGDKVQQGKLYFPQFGENTGDHKKQYLRKGHSPSIRVDTDAENLTRNANSTLNKQLGSGTKTLETSFTDMLGVSYGTIKHLYNIRLTVRISSDGATVPVVPRHPFPVYAFIVQNAAHRSAASDNVGTNKNLACIINDPCLRGKAKSGISKPRIECQITSFMCCVR